MKKAPLVAIVIPTRDNVNDLSDCLYSIRRLDHPADRISVTIWDNHSKPEARLRHHRLIDSFRSASGIQIELIEKEANFGVYASRHGLFGQIRPEADFVLSIDDDVVLPENLLKDLLPAFSMDPLLGVLGPRTVFDAAPEKTAHGAGLVRWWSGRYDEIDADKPMMCDYVIGCCMLISMAVVKKIGSFDPDYFTSHGEVDFCLRAIRAGFHVRYDPSVVVRHRVDFNGTRTPDRIYYIYRNKFRVIRRQGPLPQKVFALAFCFCFGFPKAIFDSLVLNPGANPIELRVIIRAMWDGWRNRSGKVL